MDPLFTCLGCPSNKWNRSFGIVGVADPAFILLTDGLGLAFPHKEMDPSKMGYSPMNHRALLILCRYIGVSSSTLDSASTISLVVLVQFVVLWTNGEFPGACSGVLD